jgi:hypothetical protein
MHSHQGKYILHYINHQSINPLASINHLTSINQTIGINDNMIQQVIRRVGEVAYELELPKGSQIHNMFHISCLEKAVGQFISTSEELPPLDEEGQIKLVPEEILEFRERKLRSRVIRECLVRGRGLPIEDATWESDQILQHHGLMLLEDEQSREGRTIMSLFE